MNLTDIKPLQPLTSGNILIVGTKASNFDDELRTHPRIIMWDSQQEHWTDKNIPSNVRAIFITRWIGHAEFNNILREARKRQITIFNPEGTGQIKKQVKELLNLSVRSDMQPVLPQEPLIEPVREQAETNTETTMPASKTGPGKKKLDVLHPFIDYKKNNTENARILLDKAEKMGIETTLGSLSQLVSVMRRRTTGRGIKTFHVSTKVPQATRQPDVVVVMLDNMVKELQDMREYLVAVTKENAALKTRINRFKAALDND